MADQAVPQAAGEAVANPPVRRAPLPRDMPDPFSRDTNKWDGKGTQVRFWLKSLQSHFEHYSFEDEGERIAYALQTITHSQVQDIVAQFAEAQGVSWEAFKNRLLKEYDEDADIGCASQLSKIVRKHETIGPQDKRAWKAFKREFEMAQLYAWRINRKFKDTLNQQLDLVPKSVEDRNLDDPYDYKVVIRVCDSIVRKRFLGNDSDSDASADSDVPVKNLSRKGKNARKEELKLMNLPRLPIKKETPEVDIKKEVQEAVALGMSMLTKEFHTMLANIPKPPPAAPSNQPPNANWMMYQY
ncbi:hypothetical protein BDQ17DRAFT_1428702 [Cyathus striatus]|nr:hypothetical protein BDQ17DRAFT_1428702 [Cyathus striatus]